MMLFFLDTKRSAAPFDLKSTACMPMIPVLVDGAGTTEGVFSRCANCTQ
jgi:hypothetical protein